jgi:hypothetical protein
MNANFLIDLSKQLEWRVEVVPPSTFHFKFATFNRDF